MKKAILSIIALVIIGLSVQAQIGYQLSLLNTATGEPRANESVTAKVVITDSTGGEVYSGTQSGVTNDFGVLSLSVGDADTFNNADSGKLPFFIEVNVDGVMIGKSQILNVPVAEYAYKLASSFTKEQLVGSWRTTGDHDVVIFTFNTDGTFKETNWGNVTYGFYEIEGNNIYIVKNNSTIAFFRYINGAIYTDFGKLYK